MNKYGIEHFSIKQLEECSESVVNEREQYWIQKLNTYGSAGYNATLGGDSKHYYNYREIADKYLELQNQKETAEYFNCDLKTVRVACKQHDVSIIPGPEQTKKKRGKSVNMLSIEGNFLQTFSDMSDAGRWLINNKITQAKLRHVVTAIGRVANGKRKTAYGYKWQFVKGVGN